MPSQLRRNLECSHLGRPLVHDVLHSAASCAVLGELCLPLPVSWRFDPFDAVSLAGWLVQRMCNARAVMLHSGEQEIKRRRHQGVLDKLGEGPLSARDLGRRFHRMSTVECRGLLHELGRMGRVVELAGDRWQLAVDASQPETQALVLSV